jgi:CHAT domain-containing protein
MSGQRLSSFIGLATWMLCGIAGAAQPNTSGPQLGQNLGGEVCHADGVLTQARQVDIFCGANTQSVGSLQVSTLGAPLPAEEGARRATILARAKTIAGALSVSEQLSCDAGQFLSEAASSDVLFLCTMQSNSWPRIVIVAGSERTVYQAEGLPTMLPVLEAAVSAASGRQVAPAEIVAGQRLLAAKLPANVLRSTTANSASYAQFVEMARVYSSGNDFAAAETAFRGALAIDTQLFGPDSAAVGLALMELALQVSNQGRFDEAGDLFRRAAPIIQASTSVDARARLNSYLALDAANQRDFAKALAFARQATADRRAEIEAANGTAGKIVGFSGLPTISSGELAHSLRIEAEMALQLDDVAGAQAAAEEALWIISLEPGLPLWWRADVLSLMAQVNERQGRVIEAERNFLDAIRLKQKLFGDSAPVVLSELRIGRFYTDQQLYPAALEHFRAAMAILEKNPVARSRIVPDQLVPFIVAVASMQASPQQRATLNAEIFRATQLVNSDVADQAIARASVRLAAANPMLAEIVRDSQEAQRARDRLRIDIAAEFAKPDDERNAAREAQLAQNLMSTSARADELLMRVQQTFPDYARLANPGPVELSDVRAQLRPGEALLSFVVGFRGSYALLVTRTELSVRRVDVESESLTADIALLRRAFVPQLGTLPEFSLRSAHALYTQLLEPFAADLKGVDHLIVAPGPVLANLPFSLLVSAMPSDATTYSDAAWLIRNMAVSQVPTSRAFVSLRQAERTRIAAPRPFLGVGDPLLTGTNRESGAPSGTSALEALALNCREASPIQPGLLRALAPLHDTAEEVNEVARALGGDSGSILLAENAREASLRARPLDQYRVVYFATHGLLPGELHCQAEPGLVLSPPEMAASSTDTDGLLEASEIAALRLNADLVVLSACNTAAAGGGRFGGGALEGLADAFFNAGARAVLASHWEVPSVETTKLMTGVFRRYGQDRMRDLAEALRQSQLDLTRVPATAHPFNWAAFTLIGVGETADAGGDTVRVGQQANGVLP